MVDRPKKLCTPMENPMLNRRDFLGRTLHGTSLLAAGTLVPQFLVSTAVAADAGKDTVLVVIELTGGNDGNTIVPMRTIFTASPPDLASTKSKSLASMITSA